MKLFLIAFLIGLSSYCASQNLSGYVVDSLNRAIPYASIVLLKSDSTYIEATTTDTLGFFLFEDRMPENMRMIVQHVNYIPFEMDIKLETHGPFFIILQEGSNTLSGAVVSASRPHVIIRDGVLSYDSKQILILKSVSNAFDVVRETPGVIGDADNVELLGASRVKIVLDDSPNTMSNEQLIIMLKSMPASRVKSVEVMYSAPARYANINGAVINILLDNDAKEEAKNLDGELGVEFQQEYYSSGSVRANMVYKTSKLTLDILATAGTGKYNREDSLYSKYSNVTGVLEVDQYSKTITHRDNVSARMGLNYKLKRSNALSASYYFNGSKSASEIMSESDFLTEGRDKIYSANRGDRGNQLHNAQIRFSKPKRYNLGAELTYYSSPEKLDFREQEENILINEYRNSSGQEILRWLIFADNSISIAKGWNLNYGGNFGLNRAENSVKYLYPDFAGDYIEDISKRVNSKLNEITGAFFVSGSGKTGDKTTLSATLKTEYFKTDYELNGTGKTLWNDWSLFPSATLSHNASKRSIIQFTLSSSKNYPSYWAISPQSTQFNSYMVVEGNPELKPSKSYRAQLLYILNRKYTFMIFGAYSPDAFQQLPYQRDGMTVYRFENLDYTLNTGIGTVIPFKWGVWDGRATVQGLRMRQKIDDFYGKEFDNRAFVSVIMLNNSFTISKSRPNLILQIDGRYQSKAIQGIYSLGNIYNLSSSLKWSLKNGSYFVVRYNNILRHQLPDPTIIDWEGQYSRRVNKEYSNVVFTFAWRIGNYKEASFERVDDSRFGR